MNLKIPSIVVLLLTVSWSASSQAVPVVVANSFFDSPTTGLPTSTLIDPTGAIPGWDARLDSGYSGVQAGGQPGQLAGHHEAYVAAYLNLVRVGSIQQDIGPALPNTTYTLTAGVAADATSVDAFTGRPGLATGEVQILPDNFVGSGYIFTSIEPNFSDVSISLTTGASVTGDIIISLESFAVGNSTDPNAVNRVDFQNVRLDAAQVPEPSAIALLAIGVICLAAAARRKVRQHTA